jgi:hypothetical protein
MRSEDLCGLNFAATSKERKGKKNVTFLKKRAAFLKRAQDLRSTFKKNHFLVSWMYLNPRHIYIRPAVGHGDDSIRCLMR